MMREKMLGDIPKTIFDNTVEGLYLFSPEGDFIAANTAFIRLFGFHSEAEFAAQFPRPWENRNDESAQSEQIRRILARQEAIIGFKSTARTKDGAMITLSENVRAVRDREGDVVCFVGSVRNISALERDSDRRQASVAQLLLQLEQSEQDKSVLLDIIDEVCVSHSVMEHAFITVVSEIMNALDNRRWWTRGRSQRIASHALKISEAMGFHEDEKSILHIASLLHDIGQSIYYVDLIDKPVRLSTAEMELLRRHPDQGAVVLQKADDFRKAIPLIRHHHERVDGKGYPDGLRGDDIPLGARIIHVVTTYDSITADRPYRPQKSREYALREIMRYARTQFDPVVAEAALAVL